jgi:hypothetical protein
MIKNLTPTLMERGKIKIGKKGSVATTKTGASFQPPQKLDHFIVTTMERGGDGNFLLDSELMQVFGGKPTEIPVRLLYDDIDLNFQTRYACFAGKQCVCSGNGEEAERLNRETNVRSTVKCPCEMLSPEYTGKTRCKINGCLSVIIDNAMSVGGVWKFRTTSFNSVNAILSGLMLIQSVTNGILSGIPLKLRIMPKTATDPQGNLRKIYMVGLEYSGGFDGLRKISYQAAIDRESHKIKMADIENQARKMIEHNPDIVDEDVVPEFYPEQISGNGEYIKPEHLDGIDELHGPTFDDLVEAAADRIDTKSLEAFVYKTATANDCSEDEVKAGAEQDFNAFLDAFNLWDAAQKKKLANVNEQFKNSGSNARPPENWKEPLPEPEEKPEEKQDSRTLSHERFDLKKLKAHDAAIFKTAVDNLTQKGTITTAAIDKMTMDEIDAVRAEVEYQATGGTTE